MSFHTTHKKPSYTRTATWVLTCQVCEKADRLNLHTAHRGARFRIDTGTALAFRFSRAMHQEEDALPLYRQVWGLVHGIITGGDAGEQEEREEREEDVPAEWTCAVCIEVLASPVKLPCGHTYCSLCVALLLDPTIATSSSACISSYRSTHPRATTPAHAADATSSAQSGSLRWT